MKILQVAYALAPVGADAVGGAEQVLSALDEAIVAAGHDSIVIALEGSRCRGRHVPLPRPDGAFDEAAQSLARLRARRAVAATLAREHVDVVHLHGVDFGAVLQDDGPPALVTLHLPRAWYPDEWLVRPRGRTYFNCVSAAQQRTFAGVPAMLPAIDNGVAIARLRFRRAKASFALALGRISPEKGLHLACDAARAAATPLVLAGRVFPYPEHQRYFADALEPRLGRGCRFVGPVGLARKRRLLAAARCLLVPSLAPESSSLVAMEALASGTPVVAFASGALAGIVEPGRTGFLVRDVGEMAHALREVGRISPEECRRSAVERFSADEMARRYLELYARIAGDRIAGARPAASDILRPASNT
ncbi:MAG TPA: glycosyltransferase [Anaeromyxobacteraceae bacterium]|nr:glycosyltransferase [Anaeromyxobacteraceae bacterium]